MSGKVEPHGQVECLGGNCKVRSKFVHHGTTSRHALDTLSSYREGRISGQICSMPETSIGKYKGAVVFTVFLLRRQFFEKCNMYR